MNSVIVLPRSPTRVASASETAAPPAAASIHYFLGMISNTRVLPATLRIDYIWISTFYA
jgi:hypothetical protein